MPGPKEERAAGCTNFSVDVQAATNTLILSFRNLYLR